jgi:X-Pro dipeptidyl-peptidase
MKTRLTAGAAIFAAVVLLLGAGAQSAVAADPPQVVVQDGVTQPVFGYTDAIRERLWIDSPYDSDRNGELDKVAVDIMRPRATEDGLKVPVIMDPSPYYSTLGRGNESELKVDVDGDGLLDKWPLFYDNYFVPRGYAVMLLDMIGTNNSTGCPTIHDVSDNLSGNVAIDWLNGRATARNAAGEEVVADWHNGKTAAIGKSYDGTLANAMAASGIDGLTTIVPITAISSYYDYTRQNGVVLRGNNYLSSLARAITDPGEDFEHCQAIRDELDANDGDETGDYSDFWAVRDYVPDARKVKASVFVVHGINDDNVMADHFSKWWYALEKHDVPRKLWLTQTGHVDPFDFRRAEWVDTLHRWFDFWLLDVQNGIMDEPMADIERAPDVFETYADWPVPGSDPTRLWFRTASTTEGEGAAGGFGYVSEKGSETRLTFQDTPSMSRNNILANLTEPSPNKLVFMSDTLTEDVHISGTPTVELTASVDQEDTNFGAVLVDLGPDTRVNWASNNGITTGTVEDCWGAQSEHDEACYKQVGKRLVTSDRELVTKGVIDALNLTKRRTATPLVPNQDYPVSFAMLPEDYVFKAGHKIAVVVVGSFSGYSSQADRNRANISVSVKNSRVTLPIVGGQAAARRAGI